MINWSDTGIVLTAKRQGEKYKVVTIFTKEHGKIRAMAPFASNSTFLTFSQVEVNYSTKTQDSLGFWKLMNEKQNWVFAMDSGNHLLVCQGICFLLNRLIPLGVPHKHLFDFTSYISDNFQRFSEREILLLYAYFEFSILEEVGFKPDSEEMAKIPRIQDFEQLPDLLGNEQIKANAKRMTSIAGHITSSHLLNIDNFCRTSIIQKIA